MPAVVVLTMVYDARSISPRFELRDQTKSALHFIFHAHDAHKVLHELLELILNLVRIFARWTQVERFKRTACSRLDLCVVHRPCAVLFGEFGGVLPGPLAENEQVG